MGTISEKLTYLNETKQLLKDKINNLGGSIDDNTTFRNYANQLQNVYDNLPKTEYQEGTEVNLGKTIKGKLDYEEDNGKKVVGIGQSSQDSTKGYQLINIEDTTTEVAGITITISGGVITINGTASRNNTFQFNAKTTTTLNGNYILASNYVSGTRSGDANFNVRDNSTSSAIFNVSLTTSQVTNTASLNNTIKYGIYVASGATFNNYVFKPMLESGTTAHDWEKYTNGASPNPNYPYPIQCVTGNIEEVVSGKNLAEMEQGDINSSTGSNTISSSVVRSKNYIPYKLNTMYYPSVNSQAPVSVFNLRFYNVNKEYIGYASLSTTGGQNFSITVVTQVTDTTPAYFRFRTQLNITDKIMLANDNDLTYEPYITPTSYQLSLGEYEFNGIGTYKDELVTDRSTGKWYKYNKIGVDRLTSTGQSWATGTTSVSGKIRYKTTSFQNLIVIPSSNNELGKLMCNYYQIQLVTSAGSYGGKQGISVDNTGAVYVNDDTYPNNLDGWETWLDTVNCKIIYALATPTLTEITDTTLITQLEAWYNAKSFNGTVLIQGNGNLPMIIKVRALKGE